MTKNEFSDARMPELQRTRQDHILLGFSLICTFCMVVWVLRSYQHGIDFADEGFYLAWIADPFKYHFSITQFGFVYHPLYVAVDGSIFLLRCINILITFGLACMLSNAVLKSHFRNIQSDRVTCLIISAALSCSALIFLRLWLPTPSYNWLSFQALLLFNLGLVRNAQIACNTSRLWSLDALLIGLGTAIAFLSKPTTAAAMGAGFLLFCLILGRSRLRLFVSAFSIGLATLLTMALVVDGSVMGFIGRLKVGIEWVVLLGGGHSPMRLFRLDSLTINTLMAKVLLLTTLLCVVSFALAVSVWRQARMTTSAISLVCGAGVISICLSVVEMLPNVGEFQHMLLYAVPIAIALCGTATLIAGKKLHLSRPRVAVAVILFLTPYFFAFGTSNNYWWFGGLVAFFYLLAAISFFSATPVFGRPIGLLLAVSFFTQLITATQVQAGMEGPYYQPVPLSRATSQVSIGPQGSQLLLAPSYARYVDEAVALTKPRGFRSGAPMIDLSGHSPGLLFAIGASNTAQPWIIGNYNQQTKFGYAGSNDVAMAALRSVPCAELVVAWILSEPEGPVKMDPSLLKSFGADLNRDYDETGFVETPLVVGGFMVPQKQFFHKPNRTYGDALAACEKTRTQRP